MEKQTSTLNGFEAIFDTLNPNVGDVNNKNLMNDASEELTDEELEAIKKGNKTEEAEDDEEELEDAKTKSTSKKTTVKEEEDEDEDEDEKSKPSKSKQKTTITETAEEDDDEPTNTDNGEEELVTGFFDAMAEKLGWEFDENEEKPKTAEDLIDYFTEIIEENSVPQYANEEIQKLDEFVKNGGNIKDYFTIDTELNLENISIEESENDQRLVVKELLKEKGFSDKLIEKKIAKYEDAGLLLDEAEDALEALTEIRVQKKELLLADQQKRAEELRKRQQEFFSSVVTEIKGMDNIYGVAIPEKDKRELLDYIFKPDANGVTKYQKDYAKSLKNLITSAYFTMKGDTLVEIAKKEGKKTAINNFKNSLSKNSGINKQSRKQTFRSDDNIWSSFTRQLRNA